MNTAIIESKDFIKSDRIVRTCDQFIGSVIIIDEQNCDFFTSGRTDRWTEVYVTRYYDYYWVKAVVIDKLFHIFAKFLVRIYFTDWVHVNNIDTISVKTLLFYILIQINQSLREKVFINWLKNYIIFWFKVLMKWMKIIFTIDLKFKKLLNHLN